MKQGKEARLYRIWVSMKNRCQNPNNYSYHNYGGRGITVCKEWQHYESFAEWALSHGYTDELLIERNDNNGPYCPENCRWATRKEQNCNTRQNHWLTYDGRTMTISQWAEATGLSQSAIFCRIQKGWSVEKTLTVRDGKHEQADKYTANGETHSLREWAEILGIEKRTLKARLNKGNMSFDQVFSRPLKSVTKQLSHNGETKSVTAWAEKLGVSADMLYKRLRSGWSVERTLSAPYGG